MSQTTSHPGDVLRNDFMAPLGLSANGLAMALRVPSTRITAIVTDTDPQPITSETVLLLANYFGTMTDFWINLQAAYDLTRVRGSLPGGLRMAHAPEARSRLQDL